MVVLGGRGGNSNSHGARLVHQIISIIKWMRASRLSIKKSLSLQEVKFLQTRASAWHRKNTWRRSDPTDTNMNFDDGINKYKY